MPTLRVRGCSSRRLLHPHRDARSRSRKIPATASATNPTAAGAVWAATMVAKHAATTTGLLAPALCKAMAAAIAVVNYAAPAISPMSDRSPAIRLSLTR
jgi:hypothetical protein